jgi:hypothetical protein
MTEQETLIENVRRTTAAMQDGQFLLTEEGLIMSADRGNICLMTERAGNPETQTALQATPDVQSAQITQINTIYGDNNQVNFATDNAVLHAVQNNGLNMQELESILSTLTQRMPTSINNTEKEQINDSIDVIRTEAHKAQPEKSKLKTALSVLQAIKGSVEFGAAITALYTFLSSLV